MVLSSSDIRWLQVGMVWPLCCSLQASQSGAVESVASGLMRILGCLCMKIHASQLILERSSSLSSALFYSSCKRQVLISMVSFLGMTSGMYLTCHCLSHSLGGHGKTQRKLAYSMTLEGSQCIGSMVEPFFSGGNAGRAWLVSCMCCMGREGTAPACPPCTAAARHHCTRAAHTIRAVAHCRQERAGWALGLT